MLATMKRCLCFFFFSSRRRHTRCGRDWSSDVCSSDLVLGINLFGRGVATHRGLRVGDRAKRVLQLYGSPGDREESEWWYRDPADSTASHVILVAIQQDHVLWIYVGWYTN